MPGLPAGLPFLSLLIGVPLLGAVSLAVVRDERWTRRIAVGTSGVELVLALAVVGAFDSGSPGLQLVERAPWIPTLGVQYLVAVDGLSVLFLPLTALLFLGVTASSWKSPGATSRLHFGLILALEAATMGVYVSLDLMLFFLFWELTLIPTFLLITLWGVGAERRYAGTKYILTMLAGGIPLLFGILLAGMELTVATGTSPAARLSFDYLDLLNRPGRPDSQAIIFLLLLLGFGVKAPILPLHTWLPTVAMEGPPGLTATLVGLKLGAYGIIRFAIPLAPDAATEYGWHVGLLGAIGVVYGALLALHQANLRRMLAFASISHVGLVLVGVSALNVQGVQGAIMHTLNFTVIAAGLMLLAGAVHRRLGSTDVANLGGLWRVVPRLSALFVLLGVASIGLPGTSGFVAEYLILLGAVRAHPGTAVLALAGAVIGAAYFLGFVRDAFFGPWPATRGHGLRDLQPREMAVVLAMAVLVVLAGIFPGPVLGTSAQAAAAWSAPFSTR